MSSNPHNWQLSSEYSRIYQTISKIPRPTIAQSQSTSESNISIKNKFSYSNTPYLTRDSLGLDFSPKKV